MLKKRLIPKLLIKHRQIGSMVRPVLVTTQGYRKVREVGDPVSQAKIYEAQFVDELIVLNIDGSEIGSDEVLLTLIGRLASETFMPLTVGGGVRTIDDIGLLLANGADKVAINYQAVRKPEIITEGAKRYGSQCIVVSIDYRCNAQGSPEIYLNHATEPTGLDPVVFAQEACERGAGEILLTNADLDGSGRGYDVPLLRQVAGLLPIPVIASGGCGLSSHFADALGEGQAEGAAAGTFFCFRDQNPMQARAHIRTAGIPIRAEV